MGRGTITPTPRSRRRESLNAVPATPIASAPVVVESVRRRSHDGSPQPRHEPRQANVLPTIAPLPKLQPGPPQDLLSAEDNRYRGRRFDHDQDYEREGLSPTLSRNPPNAVAPRPQSIGRYDEPEGGETHTDFVSACIS
ncbi:hypothetical protein BJV78DRAFT_205476 [Lactifluus subvellereus]|nr:hypothetical protein BJV78DRAFT_205476 [Lactifluus subvellereus]